MDEKDKGKKGFYELVADKAPEAPSKEDAKGLAKSQGMLKEMLNGEIPHQRCPSFEEAIMTHDYLASFKKTVTEVAIQPQEPVMIGQDLLATTIPMPGLYTEVRVPAFGALKAAEIGVGMEYPEDRISSIEHAMSVAIRKFGLRVSIAEEVLRASNWPLVGMHIKAAGLALKRLKEQTIWNGLDEYCFTVFDNDSGFAAAHWATPSASPYDDTGIDNANLITHGLSATGHYNGNITLLDIMDMMGQLMANGYEPTDLVMHPLAWVILAKDPILRNFAWQQGISTVPWTKIGPNAQQANMPFGLQINVSPFIYINTSATPFVTTIYVGSRNTTIGLIQGDGPETESFNEPRNDTTNMKIREYWGVAALDYGLGWTKAVGIRIAESYGPVELNAQVYTAS
jgi:hypothetical protein